jgi:hypothetical protein
MGAAGEGKVRAKPILDLASRSVKGSTKPEAGVVKAQQ